MPERIIGNINISFLIFPELTTVAVYTHSQVWLYGSNQIRVKNSAKIHTKYERNRVLIATEFNGKESLIGRPVYCQTSVSVQPHVLVSF